MKTSPPQKNPTKATAIATIAAITFVPVYAHAVVSRDVSVQASSGKPYDPTTSNTNVTFASLNFFQDSVFNSSTTNARSWVVPLDLPFIENSAFVTSYNISARCSSGFAQARVYSNGSTVAISTTSACQGQSTDVSLPTPAFQTGTGRTAQVLFRLNANGGGAHSARLLTNI